MRFFQDTFVLIPLVALRVTFPYLQHWCARLSKVTYFRRIPSLPGPICLGLCLVIEIFISWKVLKSNM